MEGIPENEGRRSDVSASEESPSGEGDQDSEPEEGHHANQEQDAGREAPQPENERIDAVDDLLTNDRQRAKRDREAREREARNGEDFVHKTGCGVVRCCSG